MAKQVGSSTSNPAAQTEIPPAIDAARKAGAIRRFNRAIQDSDHYAARRKAKTSATIFFDHGEDIELSYEKSPEGWCTIPEDIVECLMTTAAGNQVISFLQDEVNRHDRRQAGQEERKAEAPNILLNAMKLYCRRQVELAKTYGDEETQRVTAVIAHFAIELYTRFDQLLTQPSIVEYIKQRLFKQPQANAIHPASNICLVPRKRTHAEVLHLKEAGKYSIKDICTLSHISQSQYYEICKRKRYSDEHPQKPQPPPRLRGGLLTEHIDFIKKLADEPSKSYTVPDICAEMSKQFNSKVSRKTVYYHLTHTLGYSYQRNHFKPVSAFEPTQKIVNFKVCKALVEFQQQQKTIICLDESGFHLGVQKEYSYAKRCTHPFRTGRSEAYKLHIIMAITQANIFAYQARREGHNEHSFVAFILDLTRKIHQLGRAYESNVVLFLDNAPFHRSGNAMKLLKMLPFPVLFNAAHWSDMNPIETVFSILKARLKKLNPRSM